MNAAPSRATASYKSTHPVRHILKESRDHGQRAFRKCSGSVHTGMRGRRRRLAQN